MEDKIIKKEDGVQCRAVLVGIECDRDDREEVEKSLDELERLLDTAGGETFARVVQSKSHLSKYAIYLHTVCILAALHLHRD